MFLTLLIITSIHLNLSVISIVTRTTSFALAVNVTHTHTLQYSSNVKHAAVCHLCSSVGEKKPYCHVENSLLLHNCQVRKNMSWL